MRRAPLIAMLVIAVGGCAAYGPSWYRPGSTEAQFDAALDNCEGSAMARFPPMTMGRPGYFSAQNEYCSPTSGGTNCEIIGPGYLPQVQSAADTNAGPRENAFRSCMFAGGWRPDWAGPGEPFAPPAPVSGMPDAAVRQALTYCRSVLPPPSNSPQNATRFDECVMSRARELSGARPPA